MYNPTPEQAEVDRKKAYETGVPHGARPGRCCASSCPRLAPGVPSSPRPLSPRRLRGGRRQVRGPRDAQAARAQRDGERASPRRPCVLRGWGRKLRLVTLCARGAALLWQALTRAGDAAPRRGVRGALLRPRLAQDEGGGCAHCHPGACPPRRVSLQQGYRAAGKLDQAGRWLSLQLGRRTSAASCLASRSCPSQARTSRTPTARSSSAWPGGGAAPAGL